MTATCPLVSETDITGGDVALATKATMSPPPAVADSVRKLNSSVAGVRGMAGYCR